MQFEKLTLACLKILRSEGYNILTSKKTKKKSSVIWYADKLKDVNDYLTGCEVKGMNPFYMYQILVIDDAIKNKKNVDLVGNVFMWL